MPADFSEVRMLSLEEIEKKQGNLRERAWNKFHQHARDNITKMNDLRTQYEELNAFVSPRGQQWPGEIRKVYQALKMPVLALNDMWPTIARIAGREMTARFIPKLTGRDADDQGLADAFDNAIRGIRERGDYENIDSSAFRTAHIGGVGAVHINVDVHQETPVFREEKVPVPQLLLDFYTRGPNYSDMTRIARGQWVDVDQAKRYSPPELADRFSEIAHLEASASDFSEDQHGDIWAAATGASADVYRSSDVTDDSLHFYRRSTREVFLVHFEWKDREPMIRLRMPVTVADLWAQVSGGGEVPESDRLDDSAQLTTPIPVPPTAEGGVTNLQALGFLVAMAEQQPTPEQGSTRPITRTITRRQLSVFQQTYSAAAGRRYEEYFNVLEHIVYQAVIVGRRVLEVRQARHNSFSILPLVCFLDETDKGNVPYGSALLLQPRQIWSNMFANAYVDALARMPKAQYVRDSERSDMSPTEKSNLEEGIARHDRVIDIPGGTEALQTLPGGSMPDGIENAFALFRQLVPAAVGQMGTAENVGDLSRVAFRLVEQQISSTERTLAESFDNLRLFRKQQARLLIAMICAYWSYEDFVEAAGVDHAEHIPRDRSLWRQALYWDLVVDEEPATRDQVQAAIEAVQQTGMWQEMPRKAVAKLHSRLFGSDVYQEWIADIEAQEPQTSIIRAAEANGVDPEALMAAVEQLMSQGQPMGQEAVA